MSDKLLLPRQDLEALFKPLSNPTRQQLLLLLAPGPITYSEILEELNIESGSFYWHIGKMKSLIDQTEDRRYELSTLGRKAHDILVYDGSSAPRETYRPEWYLRIYSPLSRVANLPSWILIQQVILLGILSYWLYSISGLIQLGSLVIVSEQSLLSLISYLASLIGITATVCLSFYLYISPSREHFQKSFIPLIIRVLLATELNFLSGSVLGILLLANLEVIANMIIIQFIITFVVLLVAIIVTSVFVDNYLDLGLNDSLLIVLAPYYVVILLSFFLNLV